MKHNPAVPDICIIGSGAIGIALATSLASAGKNITLLEAGGLEITEKSQSHFICDSTGHSHPGSSLSRFRVFGGSTERWGGQAMRFDPIDLEPRDWILPQGWPISYNELSEFYRHAETFLGVSPDHYQHAISTIPKVAKKLSCDGLINAQDSPFCVHSSIFTSQPRLREKYQRELSNNRITLLKNAPALRLNTDGLGNITSVVCLTDEGEREIKARNFILATGGIENARFLLIQKHRFDVTELNDHQCIGIAFQDHPGCHLGEITGKGAALFQSVFRLIPTQDQFIKGRISWSPEYRNTHNLPAVSGTFLMLRKSSPYDEHCFGRQRIPSVRECLLSVRCLSKGLVYSPLHQTILAVSAEDLRNKESHISLSTSRTDPNGLPIAQVHWNIDPRVSESIFQYAREFKHRYENILAWGKFRPFQFLEDPSSIHSRLADNAHHIGATAMAADISTGVADSNSKVFNFQNLWLAGTSILPTGSHANPTLTALALAFRLSDHLVSLPSNDNRSL